jgi:AcrR family transcriptional regulator
VTVEQAALADHASALRADARRNRARILAAARDVFVEEGPGAPLEAIARRAGTGIATLYRRFPDRQALMRAVVLDALERTTQEAHRAAAEEPTAFDALASYMHRALDTRIAAVIPVLLEQVALDDADLLRARQQSTRLLRYLVDTAHRDGTLRPEVTDQLAHRHLSLVAGGLRSGSGVAADRTTTPLPGPAMTLDDLHHLHAPPPPPPAQPDPTRRQHRAGELTDEGERHG